MRFEGCQEAHDFGCVHGGGNAGAGALKRKVRKKKIWDPNADNQYLGFLCFGKQSLQYTGLPSAGLNGTSHSFPQSAQVALCISRGPSKDLLCPPLLPRGPLLP